MYMDCTCFAGLFFFFLRLAFKSLIRAMASKLVFQLSMHRLMLDCMHVDHNIIIAILWLSHIKIMTSLTHFIYGCMHDVNWPRPLLPGMLCGLKSLLKQ